MNRVDFELGDSSSLRHELLLMLEKELLFIRELCESRPGMNKTAVHETRRTLKKCRALIRLVRDPMGYASYYRENTRMRNMHRLLSRARDTEVFFTMLKKLPKKYHTAREEAWYQKTLENAKILRNRERERINTENVHREISLGTNRCIDNLAHYQLEEDGFTLIEDGLSRVYRQGRRMIPEAFMPGADAAVVHRFRKKAKYHQFQLTYLIPVSPGLLKPASKTMQRLTDKLGMYNDYHHAVEWIPGLAPGDRVSRRKINQLLENLKADMVRLKGEARLVSDKLYAEEPDQFIDLPPGYPVPACQPGDPFNGMVVVVVHAELVGESLHHF